MSHSKWLLGISVLTVSFAAQSHRYECPAYLMDGQMRHVFLSIRIYDGPQKNLAELMPVDTKNSSDFSTDPNSDTYMVCGYKGTDKTITIHARGVSVCKGIPSPGTAYCE
jgi:hypothetical protein